MSEDKQKIWVIEAYNYEDTWTFELFRNETKARTRYRELNAKIRGPEDRDFHEPMGYSLKSRLTED